MPNHAGWKTLSCHAECRVNNNLIRQEWESFERLRISELQKPLECFALILMKAVPKKCKSIDVRTTL
jgi:hypothetical protein